MDVYLVAAIVLFVIGFLGGFLNTMVIFIIWKHKQLWTPVNIILFNLACGDLLMSVFGNSLAFSSAVAKKWIFGKTLCTIYGFSMGLLGIASIISLAVLAFERYLIVCKSFSKCIVDAKAAYLIVIGIWVYALLLTVPPLFGWGRYVNEAANISCSINWEERSYNSKTYIMFLFTMGLILPLIVILFSYLSILKRMRKSAIRVGKTPPTENRITCMVFLMIVSFLITWIPYAILALIIQFGDKKFVTPVLAVVPSILAKSSICLNPIVYVGLNSQFHQTLQQLISSSRRYQRDNDSSSSAMHLTKMTELLPQIRKTTE